MSVTLRRTHKDDPAFRSLVGELDAWLAAKNGDAQTFYNQFNGIESVPYALVAEKDGVPIGCGALRPLSETAIEVKRMYVQPSQRGARVGEQILVELLEWAQELAFPEAVLETGTDHIPALTLYRRMGFIEIPNYGQYAGVETSVCLSKSLGAGRV